MSDTPVDPSGYDDVTYIPLTREQLEKLANGKVVWIQHTQERPHRCQRCAAADEAWADDVMRQAGRQQQETVRPGGIEPPLPG